MSSAAQGHTKPKLIQTITKLRFTKFNSNYRKHLQNEQIYKIRNSQKERKIPQMLVLWKGSGLPKISQHSHSHLVWRWCQSKPDFVWDTRNRISGSQHSVWHSVLCCEYTQTHAQNEGETQHYKVYTHIHIHTYIHTYTHTYIVCVYFEVAQNKFPPHEVSLLSAMPSWQDDYHKATSLPGEEQPPRNYFKLLTPPTPSRMAPLFLSVHFCHKSVLLW